MGDSYWYAVLWGWDPLFLCLVVAEWGSWIVWLGFALSGFLLGIAVAGSGAVSVADPWLLG